MILDYGLVNGLVLGISQESAFMVEEEDDAKISREIGCIHFFILFFRVTLLFD